MLPALVALALLRPVGPDDPPPAKKPPSAEQLKAITARGRLIAEHDQAAWHASDAVQKLGIKEGSIEGYIAHKTDQGWVVAFGRLKDKEGPYLIAYEASQGKDPKEFRAKALDPPREDTGFLRGAARALRVARADFVKTFKGPQRPYNFALLPADKEQWWVYFVPAQTEAEIYPLGGDLRYLISKDGDRIVEKRQLHKSVIDNPPPKDDGNVPVMGIHTHVLDSIPEDTDVFHVLRKEAPVPEMIVTEASVFTVGADGEITYNGRREDVFKPDAKPPAK
jgi:hypothetical protein